MAETYGFFDAEELADETWDREYVAEQWANYFKLFVGNGVFANPDNQLKVLANRGMIVTLSPGWAFINGYWYHNDSVMNFEIPANTGAETQHHGMFVQFNQADRTITTVVGENRTYLERNSAIYELEIAEITVEAGVSEITDAMITDTRPVKAVCGFVSGLFDIIDTTELFEQYQSIFDDFLQHLRDELDENQAAHLQNEIDALGDTYLTRDGANSVSTLSFDNTEQIHTKIADTRYTLLNVIQNIRFVTLVYESDSYICYFGTFTRPSGSQTKIGLYRGARSQWTPTNAVLMKLSSTSGMSQNTSYPLSIETPDITEENSYGTYYFNYNTLRDTYLSGYTDLKCESFNVDRDATGLSNTPVFQISNLHLEVQEVTEGYDPESPAYKIVGSGTLTYLASDTFERGYVAFSNLDIIQGLLLQNISVDVEDDYICLGKNNIPTPHSHLLGSGLTAAADYQTILGKNNSPDIKQAFILGNGEHNDPYRQSNLIAVDWKGNIAHKGVRYIEQGVCKGLLVASDEAPKFVLEDGATYMLVTSTRLKSTQAFRDMRSWYIAAPWDPSGIGVTTTAQAKANIAIVGSTGTVGCNINVNLTESYETTDANNNSITAYHAKVGIGSCTTDCWVRWSLFKIAGSVGDFDE